jgi:hypothetical protein
VISRDLLIGGWGTTTPSSHMIAKHKSLPDPWSARSYSSSSHFFRTARGSLSHGLELTIAFMKTLSPPRLLVIGPNTERIESWPSSELRAPQYGTRPYDGLRPYKPQNAEGIRTELSGGHQKATTNDTSRFLSYPPISEPTPNGLPLRAINAPSPPDDPPGVRETLYGLVVRPKTLLKDSGH